MTRWTAAAAAMWLVLGGIAGNAATAPDGKPNIVYILADDLGYGDVRILNPNGKIPTPHLDAMAGQGMIFTDAHSGSAVCTPTRYGILTGRYCWRTRLGKGVLGGWSRHLIAEDRVTVASFLKSNGYRTGCFGKWHLGMDWSVAGNEDPGDEINPAIDPKIVDYSRPIQHGPNAAGFDVYFGISASLDMPPFVFIENDRATALPTATKKWLRAGPAAPDFEAVDVLPTVTRHAADFIAREARSGAPFFVYLPLNSPHTPIVPSPEFAGKSGLNPYADFVMQTDAAVGEILRAIEAAGATTRTLVIFTSDNGCSPSANFPELLAKGHNPSHIFRGHKADIFEGGHRIPFLVRWPGVVKAGSQCGQTVCLTDLLATTADILGVALPPTAGEDSVSLMPLLRETARAPVREATVHHSINGSFSIRQGHWKLELCPDSGGWSKPRPGSKDAQGLPPVQLYAMDSDIGETANVAAEHPDVVEKLTRLMQSYVDRGRSTPGPAQPNDRDISIARPETPPKKSAGKRK